MSLSSDCRSRRNSAIGVENDFPFLRHDRASWGVPVEFPLFSRDSICLHPTSGPSPRRFSEHSTCRQGRWVREPPSSVVKWESRRRKSIWAWFNPTFCSISISIDCGRTVACLCTFWCKDSEYFFKTKEFSGNSLFHTIFILSIDPQM